MRNRTRACPFSYSVIYRVLQLPVDYAVMRSGCWGAACSTIAAAAGLAGCGGSTSTSTSTSTAANSAVVVQVTSPASGTVINGNNVTVRGTVSPANATVQVQGHPAAVGNGVFTGDASLQSGKTTIDVIGSAPNESPGSTSVVITRAGGGGSSAGSSKGPANSSGATPGVANAQPGTGSASGGQTPCGGGLSVGPSTSCAFAQNVRAAYQGPGSYSVFSPVTNQSYSMTCNVNNGQVVCTGGNNASVYFPG
jgi:hypothetical protein